MGIGADRWRNRGWLLGFRPSKEQQARWGLEGPKSIVPVAQETQSQGGFYPSVLAWPLLRMINQEKQI
ncbi:hypothetical protein KA078_03915 [Candidatus Woesebacteria bacterium]|nr:hypothetical protein [Candidatus Woesebacteria bacterium]